MLRESYPPKIGSYALPVPRARVELGLRGGQHMKQLGFGLLGLSALLYVVVLVVMLVLALPIGIIGLTALLGLGLLFIQVLRERLNNPEDDYYSRTVEK